MGGAEAGGPAQLCTLSLDTGRRTILLKGDLQDVEARLSALTRSTVGDETREPVQLNTGTTGTRVGLTVLHGRPVPGTGLGIVVAVPGGAVTREKGWLALLDASAVSGRLENIRLLGVQPGRLEQTLEALAELPPDEPPIHVEHPEFRWRYPYPLTEELFLALTDRAIWVVDAEGNAEVLYAEEELQGELAWVGVVSGKG